VVDIEKGKERGGKGEEREGRGEEVDPPSKVRRGGSG